MATTAVGMRSTGKKAAAKRHPAAKKGAARKPGIPKSLVGSTVRWSFDEGPTKGSIYEHTFNRDGSVEYREVTEGKDKGKGKAVRRREDHGNCSCNLIPGVVGLYTNCRAQFRRHDRPFVCVKRKRVVPSEGDL